MKRPPTCNHLSLATYKVCGRKAVGMINKAGYCQDHIKQAERNFGPAKMILPEEFFDEKELRGKI